jgi:hypothetical protein
MFVGGYIGLGTTASVAAGAVATLVLGAITTVFPLRMGLRAFRRLEF